MTATTGAGQTAAVHLEGWRRSSSGQQECEQVEGAPLSCSSPGSSRGGCQSMQQPESQHPLGGPRGSVHNPVAQQQGALLSQGIHTSCSVSTVCDSVAKLWFDQLWHVKWHAELQSQHPLHLELSILSVK